MRGRCDHRYPSTRAYKPFYDPQGFLVVNRRSPEDRPSIFETHSLERFVSGMCSMSFTRRVHSVAAYYCEHRSSSPEIMRRISGDQFVLPPRLVYRGLAASDQAQCRMLASGTGTDTAPAWLTLDRTAARRRPLA